MIVIVGCVDLQCSFRIRRRGEKERHEDGKREIEERVVVAYHTRLH